MIRHVWGSSCSWADQIRDLGEANGYIGLYCLQVPQVVYLVCARMAWKHLINNNNVREVYKYHYHHHYFHIIIIIRVLCYTFNRLASIYICYLSRTFFHEEM